MRITHKVTYLLDLRQAELHAFHVHLFCELQYGAGLTSICYHIGSLSYISASSYYTCSSDYIIIISDVPRSWGFTVCSRLHTLVVAPSLYPYKAWLRIVHASGVSLNSRNFYPGTWQNSYFKPL